MAHPALKAVIHLLEQRVAWINAQFGKAVFFFAGLFNGAPKGMHHVVHAVADTKNGDVQVKNTGVYARAVFFING